MAWRSQEMAANMEEMHHQSSNTSGQGTSDGTGLSTSSIPAELYGDGFSILEEKLGPDVVMGMVDRKGEIDLRNLKGDQAVRYLSALGLMVPMIPLGPTKPGTLISRG